jgi:hypothetical protein
MTMKEKRLPRYSQTVVDNLRSSQPNLAEFTDDQIDKAHRNWSVSEDFPDESQIIHWVQAPEYE